MIEVLSIAEKMILWTNLSHKATGYKSEILANNRKFRLKNGKNDKKKKNLTRFPVISSQNFGISDISGQICIGLKLMIMNDDIRFLHLCGRLMTGKDIDDCYADHALADNVLYHAFGMSSDDILENLLGNVDNATLFY